MSLERCVAALDRACTDLHAEIVVVQATDSPADPAPASCTPLRTLHVRAGALVPQLWKHGFDVTRGECVAFTLANCEVSEGWAREMLSALHAEAAGVGGPIECAPDLGLVDRAVYYLRYSAFLPSRVVDGLVSGEIPGDNAAYRHEALARHRDAIADGFFEVLFHVRLRRDGATLCMRRGAAARFWGGVSLRDAIRHRFAHGRHFGAWRVSEGQRSWWQIGLAAPVVPFLLALRAAGRVVNSTARRWHFVSALPAFLVIASAWAAGEAFGAVRGAGLR
ncbi:MAG: hypothetical protein JJE40_14250 [Vicinamibacteria bacterium]|nr:hypothetical protein [Vicinamibacteria bacterium]